MFRISPHDEGRQIWFPLLAAQITSKKVWRSTANATRLAPLNMITFERSKEMEFFYFFVEFNSVQKTKIKKSFKACLILIKEHKENPDDNTFVASLLPIF